MPPEEFCWTDPPDWLDREEAVLAPFATRTRLSRGRRYAPMMEGLAAARDAVGGEAETPGGSAQKLGSDASSTGSRMPRRDARIVAYDMDPAERLERGLRRALDALRVGDIADGAADVRRYLLQAFDSGLQRVRFDIG